MSLELSTTVLDKKSTLTIKYPCGLWEYLEVFFGTGMGSGSSCNGIWYFVQNGAYDHILLKHLYGCHLKWLQSANPLCFNGGHHQKWYLKFMYTKWCLSLLQRMPSCFQLVRGLYWTILCINSVHIMGQLLNLTPEAKYITRTADLTSAHCRCCSSIKNDTIAFLSIDYCCGSAVFSCCMLVLNWHTPHWAPSVK